jgi:hypothetical protein
MAITTIGMQSFQELLDTLVKRRDAIRLAKIADYSFVEPERQGPAIVMQPKVKLVVTAYDPSNEEILRWEEKDDARSMITIHAGTGRGTHNDSSIRRKSDLMRQKLELAGFAVATGELTEQSVREILAS